MSMDHDYFCLNPHRPNGARTILRSLC